MTEAGSELLTYRDKKFADLLKSDDLVKLKGDAKALEREIAELGEQKKVLESQITALQDAQRRLNRFLEQFSG